MGIDELNINEGLPRTINGWSEVSLTDDEYSPAKFFDAVKQAIYERICCVGFPGYGYKFIEDFIKYPISRNTIKYELFELIENVMYYIAQYFICGIGDSSYSSVGYKYKKDYSDFPFFLGKDKFGVNDDIAFFKRPGYMCTWNQILDSGYAYRLMNAINAMTSLCTERYIRKVAWIRNYGYIYGTGTYESIDKLINEANRVLQLKEPDVWGDYPYPFDYNASDYVYIGIRIRSKYSYNGSIQYYQYGYIEDNDSKLCSILKSTHPGNRIQANCIFRGFGNSINTYPDILKDNHAPGYYVKDSYVEQYPFVSILPQEPLFCPYGKTISLEKSHIVFNQFSPKLLPFFPDEDGTLCFQYGQRHIFTQWYDFGIEGGFRFRSGS